MYEVDIKMILVLQKPITEYLQLTLYDTEFRVLKKHQFGVGCYYVDFHLNFESLNDKTVKVYYMPNKYTSNDLVLLEQAAIKFISIGIENVIEHL